MTDKQYAIEEVGGKKHHGQYTKKHHKPTNTVVVGKVYADWCGHCQSLKPEWKKMKHHIHTKKGKLNVVFVEIEEKAIDHKLKQLEKKYGVKVDANGYPTLFKIENGKVDYYGGNRESMEMSNWFLGGGSGGEGEEKGEPLPGLMRDVQGGTRRHYSGRRHNRYKGKYFDPEYNKHTRKNRSTKSYYPNKNKTRNSPGIFDFLFGK